MIVSILVIKSYNSSVEDAEGRTLSAAPPQPLCGSAVKTSMASLVGVTCVTRRGISLEIRLRKGGAAVRAFAIQHLLLTGTLKSRCINI